MPLYEYRCKACGHRFEKIQTFSAPDEKECPVCGSEVERLISAPAVHFSGSGFYSTDYKAHSPSSSPTESRSKDNASSKGDGSKSEGGKDSSSTSSGDGGSKSSSDNSSSSTPAASSAPTSSSSSSKE